MFTHTAVRCHAVRVLPTALTAEGLDAKRDRAFLQTGDVAGARMLQQAHQVGWAEADTSEERGRHVLAMVRHLEDLGYRVGRATRTKAVELMARSRDYEGARSVIDTPAFRGAEDAVPALLHGLLAERVALRELWADGVERDIELVLDFAYQRYKAGAQKLTSRTPVTIMRTLLAFHFHNPHPRRLWTLFQRYCEMHTYTAAEEYTRAVNAYIHCFASLPVANRFLEKQFARERRYVAEAAAIHHTLLWLCKQQANVQGFQRLMSVMKNKGLRLDVPRPPGSVDAAAKRLQLRQVGGALVDPAFLSARGRGAPTATPTPDDGTATHTLPEAGAEGVGSTPSAHDVAEGSPVVHTAVFEEEDDDNEHGCGLTAAEPTPSVENAGGAVAVADGVAAARTPQPPQEPPRRGSEYVFEPKVLLMYLECLCNVGSWEKAWEYYERRVRIMNGPPCAALLSMCIRSARAPDDEWVKRAELLFAAYQREATDGGAYRAAWAAMFALYAKIDAPAKSEGLMARYTALGMFPFYPPVLTAYAAATGRTVEEACGVLYETRHAVDFFRRYTYGPLSLGDESVRFRR